MSRAQDVTKAMLEGDFSLVEAFSTRSGSLYRVFRPHAGEPRPSGVSIEPLTALYNEKGQFVVRGGIYGRQAGSSRLNGLGAISDGTISNTTTVVDITLRRDELEALLARPQKEVLQAIACVTDVRGTVYSFIRNFLEAMGTIEPKFLPEQIFLYEGELFASGRLWGDSRYERGGAATLSGIESVTLRDGSVLNALKGFRVASATPETTGALTLP